MYKFAKMSFPRWGRLAALAAVAFALPAFADDWLYDSAAGTITDGVWTFNATVASGNKMTVGTCVTYPDSVSLLDFAKPVKDEDDNVYTIKALNTAMVTFSRTGGRPEESTDKGMAAKVGELRLPATGLTSIGQGAFCRTSNCTNVVNYLPDSVTSIGYSAFAYCGAKRDLFLRGINGSADRGIFYSSKITSVTFGPGFTTMSDTSNKMAPFQSCSQITNIVFDPSSSGVTLPLNAFRASITLKRPLVLYGVTTINNSAFSSCNVSSITFDSCIQSIGTLANVTALTEVHFLGGPPSSQTGTFANYNQGTATVKTYIPYEYRQQWWQYADDYDPAMTDAQKERLIQYDESSGTRFSSTYATNPDKRPLLIAEKSWIVVFADWDGTELGATTVLDGEDATPPANPTREGYRFTGWSGPYQNVQAGATLTAQYEIAGYTVRFLDYDGTVLDSQTVDHGASATPPANPTREGWRFIGWSDSYECITSAKDITAIYADANTVTHIVTFKDWDGTEISRQEIIEGESAIQPLDPVPPSGDMLFYKWSCDFSSVMSDLEVVAMYVNKTVEIDTGAKFAEFMASKFVTNSVVTFALTSDISLSGVTYTKPDTFAATLDGRGHTIGDFPSDANIRSLCDTLTGTVRDLTIANYTSPNSVGLTSILARKAQGATVSGVVLANCLWTVPNADQGTAGFIYETEAPLTTITNCAMVNCKVLGVDCGGNSGGEPQLLGGFVAKASDLMLVDCNVMVDNTDELAIGDGVSVAGAFVGKCEERVTIMRCSNNARVAVKKLVYPDVGGAGGFVGIFNGIVGTGTETIITNCANFGKVESTVNYPAGGFVGDANCPTNSQKYLTLRSNFNYGDVSSPLAAGGHLGRFLGARYLMVNEGNSGSISSPSGAAGGFVGLIGYNFKSRYAGFRNVVQCGAVSTESGFAGILVGGLTGPTMPKSTLVVSNVYMAGSATATGGGRTGLAFAGRDTAPTNDLTVAIGGNTINGKELKSKVLDSNASIPLYYTNMSDDSAVAWDSPLTFTASALVDQTILDELNTYATKNKHAAWIQGKDFPEISTFGKVPNAGLLLLIY